MYDENREEFYVSELRSALEDYRKVEKELERINTARRANSRLVRSLINVLKIKVGDEQTKAMLEQAGLLKDAMPFLASDTELAARGKGKRGRKSMGHPITKEEILKKGTPVRMLTGNYEGYTGVVASSQARKVEGGLDVTYFLNLVGPDGERKRTSVKHGTMRISWDVVEPGKEK